MPLNLKTQAAVLASEKAFLQTSQSAITDVNVGSAVSTILNTVAASIANLYANLEDLYTASFISTATGTDLDARAADFGITRSPATAATVTETYYTNTFSATPLTIPAGNQVTNLATAPISITYSTISSTVWNPVITNEPHTYTVGNQYLCPLTDIYQNSYALDSRQVASITSITGTVNGSGGYTFVQNEDYILDTSCDGNQALVTWLGDPIDMSTPVTSTPPATTPIAPDDGTEFFVNYDALSVDVTAQALQAGTSYQVTPFQLTVAINLPAGFSGVINYEASAGGTNQETDAQLRAAVQEFLSSIGGPTVPAIIAKTETVPGVVSADVIEPVPPQGYVTVVADDGTGNASATLIASVLATLNGNPTNPGIRPAGIMYSVIPPMVTLINITYSITLSPGANISTVEANITSALQSYFSTLTTGSKVVRSKIAAAIQNVGGVSEVDLSNLLIVTNTIPPVGGLSGDIILPANVTPRLGVAAPV